LEESVKAQNGTIQHLMQQIMDSEDVLRQTREILLDWVKVLESRMRELGNSDAGIQAVRDGHLHFLRAYAALGRSDETGPPDNLL
jgi:hypothetical protein